MPLFALVCHDRPGALDIRKANREAHLGHIRDSGVVQQAGPFLDAGGEMCGSLIIMDVPDREAAQAWADGDPYAKAGLFASVRVEHWNRVIG